MTSKIIQELTTIIKRSLVISDQGLAWMKRAEPLRPQKPMLVTTGE